MLKNIIMCHLCLCYLNYPFPNFVFVILITLSLLFSDSKALSSLSCSQHTCQMVMTDEGVNWGLNLGLVGQWTF